MDTTRTARKPYPSDVSDEEWAFVAPYLALVREDAPQRKYELREVFNALRWMVRAGAAWRMLPTNLPPWEGVPADPALDQGRLLRGDGARPAGDPAPGRRARAGADRHRPRWPHPAVDPGERRACRL